MSTFAKKAVERAGLPAKEEELTDFDIKKLKKMPNVESYYNMSNDGKFLIHKTIITDIKPMSYMEKVVEGKKDG